MYKVIKVHYGNDVSAYRVVGISSNKELITFATLPTLHAAESLAEELSIVS